MGFFGITDKIHERWCQFIIHRYLGHILEKKLSLDQLSMDLSNGCIKIEQVMLSTQFINDHLTSMNVPLRLIDGFLGRLEMEVPWKDPMNNASKVQLSDVQLTFRATDAFKLDDKDLVSSMIGSVAESIVSSMDLASSFYREDNKNNDEDWEEKNKDSISELSKVIDALVSRFCCTIDDLIIRIEADTVKNAEFSTAVELKVVKMEFMDEQMRHCRQDGRSPETITSQPHGLGAITDMSKHLLLTGVSLFTDTFSKADLPQVPETLSPVTSMYLRREHKKSLQKANSPVVSMYMSTMMGESATDVFYQSCYSHLAAHSSIGGDNFADFKSVRPEPKLLSNPVKFAEMNGETQIIIRIKATDVKASEKKESKVEFEVFAKGMNILVTPSQVELVRTLMALLMPIEEKPKGRPSGELMDDPAFDLVNRQLDNITTDDFPRATNAIRGFGGNWTGTEAYQSINLNNDGPPSIHLQRKQASVTPIPETTGKQETAIIKLNLGTLLVYLAHEDHLSVDNVKRFDRGARDAVEILHQNSKRFFESAPNLKFHASTNIQKLQSAADGLLVGSGVSASYTVESLKNGDQRVLSRLTVSNCDVCEFLDLNSTVEMKEHSHIPLARFERDDGDHDASFTVIMNHERDQTATTIILGKCSTEMDMSMADRISEFICPRPFFNHTNDYKTRCEPSSGLNENLFAEVEYKEPPNNTIEIRSSHWTVDLVIPRVDLREEVSDEEKIKHTIRNLHDEKLRLKLTNAEVLLPPPKRDGPKCVEISAGRLVGSFLGDPVKLGCSVEQMAFLYAGTAKMNPVKISLEFDGRNKSLKTTSSAYMPHGLEDMSKSFSADVVRNIPRMDGPFSKSNSGFTRHDGSHSGDENIVRAGNRAEMEAFAKDCLDQSVVTLKIVVPTMRLQIPNHQFLELLYNRMANDFALWQPSSPSLRAKDADLNIAIDDFKEVKRKMRNRSHLPSHYESDEEELEESEWGRRDREKAAAARSDALLRSQSHTFCMQLDVHEGKLVLGTEIALESEVKEKAQLAGELTGTQLFLCYGFHGDPCQTFFSMTTTGLSLAQRNRDCTIPSNINSKDFGSHDKNEVHLRSLPKNSVMRAGRTDDCLAVALHKVVSPDGRIFENTVAVSFRLTEMAMIPFASWPEWWPMQLKDLLYLVDFDIPGYEMPEVNTYLHVHFDNAILSHDHARVNPSSNIRLKFVLGNVDISAPMAAAMRINTFLFLMERIHVHMTTAENDDDQQRTISYADEKKNPPGSNMIHIAEIGLFQFELLFYNEAIRPDLPRECPQVEFKCQNDNVKVWVCQDSLATLVNMLIDIQNFNSVEASKEEAKVEEEGDEDEDEEMTDSTATATTLTQGQRRGTADSQGSTSEERAAARANMMVQDAVMTEVEMPAPSPKKRPENDPRDIGIMYGHDALDDLEDANSISSEGRAMLTDCLNDMSCDSSPSTRHRTISTDEEFFMVEDIVGCGITSSSGEPRIRCIDGENSVDPNNYQYEIHPEHLLYVGQRREGSIPLPPNHPPPEFRLNVKDISIQLHIFGGNDLGKGHDTTKTYSADEYREGVGKGQIVKKEARGGPFRDHSVCVMFELSKISFVQQTFGREAEASKMNLLSIQDVTVHDRLALSTIKEILYQHATTDRPRRTCAPMLAMRMVENHKRDAKLRVSMLPIRINIDQDTSDFLEDFFTGLIGSLHLPEKAVEKLQRRPMVEVEDNPMFASGYRGSSPPLLSGPLKPTPSPRPPRKDTDIRMSNIANADLGDLYGFRMPPSRPSPEAEASPPQMAPPPVAPPRRSKWDADLGAVVHEDGLRESRCQTPPNATPLNPFDNHHDDFGPLDDDDRLELSPLGGPSTSDDEAPSPPKRNDINTKSIFDMRDSIASHGNVQGAWGSSIGDDTLLESEERMKRSRAADDILSRSTMDGSLHQSQLYPHLSNPNSLEQQTNGHGGSFLDDEDRVSSPMLLHEEPLVDTGDDADERETIGEEPRERMKESRLDDDPARSAAFFKEFVFSPPCTIYIDYHGKNKYNMERAGAVLGVLRGIGQLNRMEINLHAIDHRNGLKGIDRCFWFAVNEWTTNATSNLPGALTALGPISPLVQIGKGIYDLLMMPVTEMGKEDGHVVKGLQKGAGSFGFSTAAAVVDIAQRFVGVVQMAAESALYECTPESPALNNRNRRPITARVAQPSDIRGGFHMAYDLMRDGLRETREDLELAAQEDRASGRSSMRTMLRYATPTILRPFVLTSQISYHLLGGLKNQLRPDEFRDEQHKWRSEKDRPGTSK